MSRTEERREREALGAKTALIAEASEEETRIELLIREKYSMSRETALHRKKLMGILSDEEWDEYTDYVESCIAEVRSEYDAE